MDKVKNLDLPENIWAFLPEDNIKVFVNYYKRLYTSEAPKLGDTEEFFKLLCLSSKWSTKYPLTL